ncbi:hypothetical protein PR202_gb14853 [Eleusine coracana subsp. coracana]|uniref:HIT domain-containing protein n=1 Tax=Eleusine coracana subsp. coracana TaxID=191504 RepID=A0AAV5EWC0_ELECO|nr:hypothetical protein PR202_gb14853 [Eleusine coracana subsp. coracana]
MMMRQHYDRSIGVTVFSVPIFCASGRACTFEPNPRYIMGLGPLTAGLAELRGPLNHTASLRSYDDRHDGGVAETAVASQKQNSGSSEAVKSTPRRRVPCLRIPSLKQPAGGAMNRSVCFGLGGSRFAKRMSERAPLVDGCVFCDIARRAPTSTTSLLYAVPGTPRLCAQDDKVVAFRDINPSAFRHYLVIPIEHIPTVKSLQRTEDDYQLVSHMVKVGKDLLNRDAPNSEEHRPDVPIADF